MLATSKRETSRAHIVDEKTKRSRVAGPGHAADVQQSTRSGLLLWLHFKPFMGITVLPRKWIPAAVSLAQRPL